MAGLSDGSTLGAVGSDAATGFSIGGPVGGVIGAGLGLVGGILGNDANSANAAAANAQSQANLTQSEMFQEQMMGSKYRLEVGDLEGAGLNPMLAVAGGVPGTGGAGVSPPAVQMPQYRSPLEAASSSAATLASLDNTHAQTEVAKSQAAVNTAQADKIQSETVGQGFTNANLLQLGDKLHSETNMSNAQVQQLLRSLASNQPEADAALTRARSQNVSADTMGMELNFPRQMKEASFWRSGAGSVAPYINQIGTSAVNSAAAIRGMLR